jgi:hypothetical protein
MNSECPRFIKKHSSLLNLSIGSKKMFFLTLNRREVLEQMEMLSAFTDVLHVSNLTRPEHVQVEVS